MNAVNNMPRIYFSVPLAKVDDDLPTHVFASYDDAKAYASTVAARYIDVREVADHDQRIHRIDLQPSRTVLVHLNVAVPSDDRRPADEIANAIEGAIEVGSDSEWMDGLVVAVTLAEQVA